MTKKIILPIFLTLFIIYEELIFHLFVFENFNANIIYLILFSLPISGIFYLLTTLLKNNWNRVIFYLIISLVTILFVSNFIYYKFYFSIISIYSIFHGGGQVFQFFNQIINIAQENWYIILALLLPIIIAISLDVFKILYFEKAPKLTKLITLLIAVLFQMIAIIGIKLDNSHEIYSNKNLYSNVHSPLLTTDRFGLSTMFRLDITRSLFGFSEKELNNGLEEEVKEPIQSQEEIQVEEEIKYNVLEIDFDSLIANEKDETIKKMHTYFSKQTGTKQNEYTGMFKDKNLIVFVAEAFSDIAIDEKLTPNLYKLYSEGFQFENFYTPLFPVSTADGEYITDTSLIPKEGVWSLYKLDGNYMPFSYANIFKDLGYTNQAYHNNTYTYYHRDLYIKAMGYDKYKACGNGLNINCRIWPQSDLEMINASINDYINDEKFLAYYMTVSGHLEYTRYDNMMSSKNWSQVKNLPYSNSVKAYLAATIEFDKAVGKVLDTLEKKGKLEDTVIVISGDHYPYGLTLDEINELSNYKRDKNFEMHRMPLLIWSGSMQEAIKVEKYGSSLDVLPTVLNLFGVEFDSRLLMGTDILSDSEPLVIYSNRSFITDKCKYNSLNGKVINLGDNSCNEDYIKRISSKIYNKYRYSKLILEKDYYRKLYKTLNWL